MDHRPDQEIDLLRFSARFYGALRKNWILTLALPLLGLAAGIAVGKMSTPPTTIQSEMLVATSLLSATETEFISRHLTLSNDIAGKISDQNLSVAFEPVLSADRDERTKYIKVTVVARDPAVLPQVEKEVIHIFDNLDRVKENRKVREAYLQQLIKKIDEELAAVEKLKTNIDFGSKANLLNPADLFIKTIDLNDTRLRYQIDLQNIQSTALISGLKDYSDVPANDIKVPAIMGLMAGIFLLLVILLIKYFLQYYNQYEKTLEA